MECTCAKFKIGDKIKFSEDGGFYTTYISMALILGLDKYQSDIDPDISMTFTVIGFNGKDEIYALTDDLGREFMASDKYAELVDQWNVYNNTMPLCELTDEQYGKMRRMHDDGAVVEFSNITNEFIFEVIEKPNWCKDQVYRIKSKSERELFIENSSRIMHSVEGDGLINDITLGALYDNGLRYKDLTQHFGENI